MNERYIKTIEKEVASILDEKPKRVAGKGLLSPTKPTATESPKQKSNRDFIVSMVADIRRKRIMLKEGL